MRDPDRIPEILSRLEQLWDRYPDLRLGQLILNAYAINLYNIEDEALIDQLYSFYDQLENARGQD